MICGNHLHLDADAKALSVQKKAIRVGVIFAESDGICETKEGDVAHKPGDAILTGLEGERWPIERSKFDATYEPISPTKAGESGSYAKRLIEVYALQMNDPFYVNVSWEAGRLEGKPGDWLLQYNSNDYGIVSKSIFGKTYEITSSPYTKR